MADLHPPVPAPFREVEFPSVDLEIERRADGVIIMTPRQQLHIDVPSVPAGLARQAAAAPARTHLAERATPDADWTRSSFAQIKNAADAAAQWLLDHGVAGEKSAGARRPVMIITGNSIAHAVMRYGAMSAGAPVCPVSANYALMGAAGGYDRLRHVTQLVRPAVIFAESANAADAVRAVAPPDALIVSREPGAFDRPTFDYEDLVSTPVSGAVEAAIADLDLDAPAAYMLTSGSTGRPKAVIQTQRMLTANLHQGWQVLGKAAGWDDVLLEWLPWSHVSGAFSSMAAAIFGGSFYIDAGKPLPGLFEPTLRNLREIPLKYFTNVPSGYAMLADALEADAELRRVFFQDLRLMLYGGAGLPQPLYDRLQDMAVAQTGKRVFFTTGYGATETTSGCMSIYFETEKVGLGLPMPGLSVKMVPNGDRYELRMKGPMVTPGYLDQPELNAALRDEDGFYKIGDTAQFHDPDDPAQGLAFTGRLAEEFKLATGTWVSGGALRANAVAALAPLVSDALVCGENRDCVALLAWPNVRAISQIASVSPEAFAADPAGVLARPEVQDAVRARLDAYNAAHPGSASRVARLAFLLEPPAVEAHEVSDKGAINQALAKQRRASDVERLYALPLDANVIVAS